MNGPRSTQDEDDFDPDPFSYWELSARFNSGEKWVGPDLIAAILNAIEKGDIVPPEIARIAQKVDRVKPHSNATAEEIELLRYVEICAAFGNISKDQINQGALEPTSFRKGVKIAQENLAKQFKKDPKSLSFIERSLVTAKSPKSFEGIVSRLRKFQGRMFRKKL